MRTVIVVRTAGVLFDGRDFACVFSLLLVPFQFLFPLRFPVRIDRIRRLCHPPSSLSLYVSVCVELELWVELTRKHLELSLLPRVIVETLPCSLHSSWAVAGAVEARRLRRAA